MTLGKMTLGKMTLGKMTLDKMTLDKMTLDKMTLDKMTLNKMTLNKMALNKMTLNKITLDIMTSDWDKMTADFDLAEIGNGTACLKNFNNCLNSNIHPYLDTSGGQSSNLYLNVVHFFQHLC